LNSKKIKALSAIPKETYGMKVATTDKVGHTEPNLPPELTQTLNSLKENNNDREVLTRIIGNTHKNASHSRNIKQGRNIGSFGLSPICMLLNTESVFSDTKYSCHICCRCKLHPKIRPHEIFKSAAKDINNIVTKTVTIFW
jgi:hypothetical protein